MLQKSRRCNLYVDIATSGVTLGSVDRVRERDRERDTGRQNDRRERERERERERGTITYMCIIITY